MYTENRECLDLPQQLAIIGIQLILSYQIDLFTVTISFSSPSEYWENVD
jgi:hypothetical protein